MIRPRTRRVCLHAAIIAMGLLGASPGAPAEEPPVFAIVNARIYPVSAPPLDKGSVLIRGGIIESIGAGLAIPGDARVIDATGLTVYPGLIDALSNVGLEEDRTSAPAPARAPGVAPGVPQQQSATQAVDERQGITPFRLAAELVNAASTKIQSARAAGITTALVAPRSGIFSGQSCLINLSGGGLGGMIVKTPVAYHVNLQAPGGFGRPYPGSVMGVFAFVKQSLLDARHYAEAWGIYTAHPGAVRPEYSRALEALQPAVAGKAPVVITGNDSVEIRRILELAESFQLNLVLSGAAESGPLASELQSRNIPVLLSVNYPERDREPDPDVKEELADLRRRVEAPGTAAVLAKAGVRFAFQASDIASPRDFVRNVGRAVEAGLDKDAALRAMTLTPAEIFGVSDRFGSIEPGKTANLILADGDLFAPSTRVKIAFVDGRRYEIAETEPPRTTQPGEATATVTAAGTWLLELTTPRGALNVTLKLQQSGETVTGTASSELGDTPIVDGRLAGGRLTFRVSAGTVQAKFSGTIHEDSITGTFDAGEMGNLDCRGSRSPQEIG